MVKQGPASVSTHVCISDEAAGAREELRSEYHPRRPKRLSAVLGSFQVCLLTRSFLHYPPVSFALVESPFASPFILTSSPMVHLPRLLAEDRDLRGGSVTSYDNAPTATAHIDLRPRQTTAFVSTCGWIDGDANKPRTASPGFNCSTDTLNGVWGFCPTSGSAAASCGLAGNCVDSHACTSGCGPLGDSSVNTITWYKSLLSTSSARFSRITIIPIPTIPFQTQMLTWVYSTNPGSNFCSSAILTVEASQTYTYIACNSAAATQHLQARVTAAASGSQSSASPTAASTSPGAASSTAVAGQSSSSQSNNDGAIVGGVIGSVLFICILALAYWVYRRENLVEAEEL